MIFWEVCGTRIYHVRNWSSALPLMLTKTQLLCSIKISPGVWWWLYYVECSTDITMNMMRLSPAWKAASHKHHFTYLVPFTAQVAPLWMFLITQPTCSLSRVTQLKDRSHWEQVNFAQIIALVSCDIVVHDDNHGANFVVWCGESVTWMVYQGNVWSHYHVTKCGS